MNNLISIDGDRRYYISSRGETMRIEKKPAPKGGVKEIETRIARVPFNAEILVDVDDSGYAIRLFWKTETGEDKEYTFELGEQHGYSSPVFTELARLAKGGFSSHKDFARYIDDILDAPPGLVQTKKSTRHAGWIGSDYVANGFKTSDSCPVLIGEPIVKWQIAGDEKAYRIKLKEMLCKNPAVAFICGYFAAGSLVQICGAENFILALLGKTSAGKTLAISTALSMRDDPDNFASFDSTENHVNALAQQSGDGCLVLDEVGQAKLTPERKQALIYSLALGKARGRCTQSGKVGTSSAAGRMYYTVIITGEESILTTNSAAGTQVRVTELLFDGDDPAKRVWESIASAKEADEWHRFIRENHGHVMPLAIQAIANDREKYFDSYTSTLEYLRQTLAHCGKDDNPTLRKAKAFALALAGAQLLDDVLDASGDIGVCGSAGEFALNQLNATVSLGAKNDDDKYADFLYSLPSRYADRLFQIQGGDEDVRSPLGSVHVGSSGIELRILVSQLDSMSARENVDLKRLLSFSEKKGWLQKSKNGTAPNGQPNYIMTKRLQVGPGKAACYQFVLPVQEQEQGDDCANI